MEDEEDIDWSNKRKSFTGGIGVASPKAKTDDKLKARRGSSAVGSSSSSNNTNWSSSSSSMEPSAVLSPPIFVSIFHCGD
ncbi:hypothetical protein L2E82_45470 [Cichorium intybus]|uniref:Uncharacterized protein n=1 Tax=Cichorium intybus TaxID=13427 RepID=A0ACB8ZTL8_CICIN|nr:hypothetical protein L2E82_45470 [Cichorium intybus]